MSDGSAGDAPSSGVVAAGDAAEAVGPEPGDDRPRARTAWQLRVQAAACAAMGSPLYDRLLRASADDCDAGGVVWSILSSHAASGRGDALALRFMAAVHRLVLARHAAGLAVHYPSVGGTAGPDGAWEAFAATLGEHRDRLVDSVGVPCQTNEVGRSAGLAIGFLDVASATGLPLRMLEVGASAGLNLRWDQFRIGGGGAAIGPLDSPVDLSAHWRTPPPEPATAVTVVERGGCDRRPIDPTTADGRLALTAAVWADQVDRLARLRGALRLATEVPAPVDTADLVDWTAQRTATLPDGAATVVYHSVVAEYLPDATRARFVEVLRSAGARATATRPLAWVRLEPISALRHHGVTVTTWPGGEDRVLARCGAHGTDVDWLPR